jgi:hypothetical protein
MTEAAMPTSATTSDRCCYIPVTLIDGTPTNPPDPDRVRSLFASFTNRRIEKKLSRIVKINLLEGACPFCIAQKFIAEDIVMCRNIKTLFNFDPPVTEEEIRAASLQFVRKITGFNKPSKANEQIFLAAIEEVAAVSNRLLCALETTAPPKNREEEAAKARARAAERFGP